MSKVLRPSGLVLPLQTFTDKSWWTEKAPMPAGPWVDEPDLAVWTFGESICALRRGFGGSWCGYASAPDGVEGVEDAVHGGITFSQAATILDALVLRAVQAAGESHEELQTWLYLVYPNGRIHHWLGFDCGHYGDARPSTFTAGTDNPFGGVYRTFDYAKEQTELLAEAIARSVSAKGVK